TMARTHDRGSCAGIVAGLVLLVVACTDEDPITGGTTTGPSTASDVAEVTQTSDASSSSGDAPEIPPCDAAEPGMVCVEAGTFWMGCNQALDENCSATEFPFHEVHLDRFDIDQHEVTVAEYRACVEAGACSESDPCNTARSDADDH